MPTLARRPVRPRSARSLVSGLAGRGFGRRSRDTGRPCSPRAATGRRTCRFSRSERLPFQPIKRFLAKTILRISRYRIVGDAPTDPVCVLVAAPHTSNWDFPLMLAMAWNSGLSPVWMGKKEMFRWPAGPVFRRIGGIPVDRKNPAGLADHVARMARDGKLSAIVIPPEATRSKKTYWKSGFRRIAADAGIPITLTYLDGPTRSGGYGPTFHPTGDVVADMDLVRAFYADKHGVKPGRFTPPLLREEEAVGAGSGPTDASGPTAS